MTRNIYGANSDHTSENSVFSHRKVIISLHLINEDFAKLGGW